ncbi:hypothetical protein BH24ACT22_BH24ACT22_02960 [soil metagenome]
MSEPKQRIPFSLRQSMKGADVEVSGHREINYATQYRLTRGPDTANLNVFHTGKISVDGKDSGLKRLLNSWRPSKPNGKSNSGTTGGKTKNPKKPVPNSMPRVGTDEAGKGEYLGPLVVAGARILGEAQDEQLREAGARDSKDLSPSQARAISGRIAEILGPENICVKSLEPTVYEQRRNDANHNVNRLLGKLNVEIIEELEAKVQVAVVDSFGVRARSYIEPHMPAGVKLKVRPKAEDDTAVAAASIMARARYLEVMDLLSEEVGFELPRGSTHVLEAARRIVDEFGEEGLKRVAKVHFSTTEKVLEGGRSGNNR